LELLLNLAWLLLALPAFWLWCDSRNLSVGRKFSALQCLLALGCVLVILFPVVSATDDLRAMRNEVEESPSSKRNLRQASNDRAFASKWQNPPALAARVSSPVESDESWLPVLTSRLCVPSVPPIARRGRAPPNSLLG
jgi:hypothetical protein